MVGQARTKGTQAEMKQIIISVMEVPLVLNISYNSAFELFQQPDFPKFHLFQSYYVRIDRLYYWLEEHDLKKYCLQQWIEAFGSKSKQVSKKASFK